MQVLQHEEERLPDRQPSDDLGHGLQETDRLLGGGGDLARRVAQLRPEEGKPVPPDGAQLLACGDLTHAPVHTQRVDPRAERQNPLRLVGAAQDGASSQPGRLDRQGLHEPCLADAGLAHEEDCTPALPPGRRQGRAQLGQHVGPADQWPVGGDGDAWARLGSGPRPRPGASTSRRCLTACPLRVQQDGPVEPLGFGLGLDPELPGQRGDAELVLPERLRPATQPGMEAHQDAVRRLPERIEREQPGGHLDLALRRAGPAGLVHQLTEGPECQLPQSLALGDEPLFEGRLAHVEPLEKVAGVQGSCPGELLGRGARHQALERDDVHLDQRRVERDRVADRQQRSGTRCRQGVTKGEQGLAKAVPRLLGRRLAPEERGELRAAMRLAGPNGQVGEQRLRLLGANHDRRPGRVSNLEAAQQRDVKPRRHSAPREGTIALALSCGLTAD